MLRSGCLPTVSGVVRSDSSFGLTAPSSRFPGQGCAQTPLWLCQLLGGQPPQHCLGAGSWDSLGSHLPTGLLVVQRLPLPKAKIASHFGVSDELVLKSGAKQDCVSTVCTDSTRMAFQSLECNSSKGEMQNDLFKAEFILITDSGDEDEVAAASNSAQQPSNGYSPISAQLLTTSHVSPGTGAGKPPGDGHLPGVPLSLSTADPQTHQMSTTLQRAAGRETRYVSTFTIALYFTKPGVIRPVLVKGKSAQQKEEPYQPNPFKKYLEEISDQNIEQVSSSHSEGFCNLS
uniref:Muscular LMNA-interacting protein n=1 Tax=Catharus ustulatus TaxID=91951 RepID=A0A8C3VJB6_CATUS